MATLWNTMRGWFGFGGALGENTGKQNPVPGTALVSDTAMIGADGALQIAAVWACIERRATTVASLPFFAYEQQQGQKALARASRLYQLLHDSPNARMTPLEFWRAMMMNHDLRGNAYARLERDARGEVLSMWPMPADQVEPIVLDDGAMVYTYRLGSDVAVLSADNVLHLKGLGNGTTGLAKLEFMRATTDEAAKAQQSASRIFGNGGKPTGVLMIDHVLKPDQRAALQERFAEMAVGSINRLYVLEANMKYEQLSLSPEDQQLLETRRFTIEEICRWFDVPPVLVHHSNVTTWGTGVEQIIDGFYKFTVRPMLVSIEQAVRKRVMTPAQRARMSVEFNLDALLRGSAKDRAELYAKLVQNGLMSRNEGRQLENLPPDASPLADALTVQSNLVPIALLGQQPATGGSVPAEPVLQSALRHALPADTSRREDEERRHRELLTIVQTLGAPRPQQPVHVDFGQAVMHVTRAEAPAPQPIHVHVPQQAAPTVNVDVQVPPQPAPTVQVDVQPAEVQLAVDLAMPPRRTETTVARNDKGEIVRTTTVETDA
jgi:HK97 family phage portal protein